MIKNGKYTENKELMIIPNAVHTDLYDKKDIIPFDKIESFFKENLKQLDLRVLIIEKTISKNINIPFYFQSKLFYII